MTAFLFDVGSGRYPLPEREADGSIERWRSDLEHVRAESAASSKAIAAAREAVHTHTQIRGWLRDWGLALGFRVWIASNDADAPSSFTFPWVGKSGRCFERQCLQTVRRPAGGNRYASTGTRSTIEAVADRRYFNSRQILACHEAGITVMLPKPLTSAPSRTGALVPIC